MNYLASFVKTGHSQKWGFFAVLFAIAGIVPIPTHAQSCAPPPSGLVSWWPGNGNATDPTGGNNGTFAGSVTYVTGEVGQAFSFNGSGEGVTVGNPPSLQLQNFTIDAWIQRGSTSKASQGSGGGLIFSYGSGGYGFGLTDNGQMLLSQIGANQVLSSASITNTSWHHVAVSENGGSVTFYLDGVANPAATYAPSFTFTTSAAVGARGDNIGNSFLGAIDEVDVFNRSLATAEIQSIYNAGSAGKCTTSPPVIITQPAGETVTAGQDTGFSVLVAGNPPFGYQWQLNNANISGATTSALNVPNAQAANAGSYTVIINNSYGSVTSSPAILTVNAPACVSPPPGLVSWWPGDGDAADQQSQYDGSLIGGAGFTSGQVGESFSFNGNGEGVFVGNPTALQMQTFTIDAWIQRASTSQASLSTGGGAVFSYGAGGYGFGLTDSGQLYLSQVTTNSTSSSALITDLLWHHIAVAKNGSNVVFFVDGIASSTQTYKATFVFSTPAAIGARGDNFANSFLGNIDELDIFNRALATAEVQSIYNASSAGKCSSTPPSILTQPTGATVAAGINVNLTVLATGTEPLNYQWQFNNANISGATSSILNLADAQAASSGNYTVIVANAYGSIASAVTALTVTSPTCVTPPSGLVGWWQGEGNGIDNMGGNNGTSEGSVTYIAGEVGQAFSFNGSGEGMTVGDPVSLQLQNFTIDAWVQRSSTTKASVSTGGGTIFAYGSGGYGFGVNDNGQLYLSKISSGEITSGATIADLAWHHAAVTKNGSVVVFYVDGVAYSAAAYNPTFTFTTPASIGAQGATAANSFLGAVDEVDVFNRPLASAEVQSIFYAGSAGKCNSSPPTVTMQPAGASVTAGNTTGFSITATGSQPVTYQWQLNNVNISGATTTSLTLPNVQLAAAGNYTVVLNNAYGTATSSIAVLTVNPASCVTSPSGLVSWWAAEGSAVDNTPSGNNGTVVGAVDYVAGKVGQAFSFSGSGAGITVGNPTDLQLQTLTIDAWIQRASTSQASQTSGGGLIFSYGAGGYGFGLTDGGQMFLSQIAANQVASTLVITDTAWHHVAVTRTGGTVIFYLDGVANPAATYNPNFTFTTPAAIGARGDNLGNSFFGNVDELDVFSRVLSAGEIQGIYNASTAGKCNVFPPSIATQPAGETIATGGTANFSVAASGPQPLSYQWQFNNANINGATASSFSIPDAQPANTGNYTVIVNNAYGSITSSIASLTVNLSGCVPPPSGLISWWPAEGNTVDIIGANNGTLHGTVTYAVGEVGQAFNFSGTGTAVTLGNPTALQLQNFTIEAWIQLSSVSATADRDILAYGNGGYIFGIHNNNALFISKAAADNVNSTYTFSDTHIHHVAVTKNGTTLVFYVDGVAYPAPAYSTTYTFGTSAAIGAKGDDLSGNFAGIIDELSVYSRALSSSEIQSIYNAASVGKCSSNPPTIVTQPANETVASGFTANFSVTAAGTLPLTYQWQFNNVNIGGATASALTLANAQSANAGNYTVIVNNPYGAVTSSIAALTVNNLTCAPPPSGLVSWWPGNGNAVDVVGNNNGTLQGAVGYVTGEVGQAFSLNGSAEGIIVGNPASLQLQNFTIDAWVQRGSTTQASSSTGVGLIFSYGADGYGFGMSDNGQLFLSQINVSQVASSASVTDLAWHHLAVTKNAATVVFYVDGVAFPAAAYNPNFTFGTTAAIGLPGGGTLSSFLGSLDEVDVFNRALVSSEIQSIFAASAAGKCTSSLSPPTILTQPANVTTTAGNNASFSVIAEGTAPLSYQWQFNNANISGATTSALSVADVQSANAGNYSVIVTNPYGFVTSSIATLTIGTPTCFPPPSGLVSWWPAEGNAVDIAGGNNGTLNGAVTFKAGEVGQAFSFSGGGTSITLGNPASLQLQNFTIEAWIQLSSVSASGDRDILAYGNGGYIFGIHNNNALFISKAAADNVNAAYTFSDTLLHHVAVTKNGHTLVFYVDGVAYPAAAYSTSYTFGTPVAIGAKGDDLSGNFAGQIDELTVYSRALSSSEIQSICNAASAGKCSSIPPTIITQPVSETTGLGDGVNFSVSADGSLPLSYQWQFNNAIISGATASTLVLANVQAANAGNYTVIVTNPFGAVTSAPAVLTVNSSPCIPTVSGLVSWWPAEGSAVDIIDGNNGTPVGSVTYSQGEVGQAFNFSGTGTAVTLGNPSALQLQNFTIEAWIQLSSVSASGDRDILAYGNGGYIFGIHNNNALFISKAAADNVNAAYTFSDTLLHHVAVTKNGTTLVFYVDGVAYPAAAYSTSYTFGTPVAIGAKGDDLSGNFAGKIDELSVYSRALAANEIQSIYNAAGAGKCTSLPPQIITQPVGETVGLGENAGFSVAAAGLPPLSYQWQFNNANISGATSSALTVADAQPANSGNYTVIVSDAFGAVTSSIAVLTVNSLACVPPLPGMVSWWPAEGNAVDIAGGNNGTLNGAVTFKAGEVGQAFSFSGGGTSITLGNPASLQLQNFTIEAWIQLSSVSASGDRDILAYGNGGYIFGIHNNNALFISKAAADNVNAAYTFSDTLLHHVAVTKNGTTLVFYVDGVAYPAAAYSTSYTFGTPVAIGAKGDDLSGNFAGQIDELTVYSRALTAVEVQTIYSAGSAGKCSSTPPAIVTQPAGLTVEAGQVATFTVAASGLGPLTYQWSFGSSPIGGATGSSYTINGAQLANAGNYSVVVANGSGSVTSATVALTVNSPVCFPPPSGLVSWWPAEGSAVDVVSGNNGTLQGTITYAAGEVGQAFDLSGAGSAITLGNPTSMQVQDFSIEAWIQLAAVSATGDRNILGYGANGYLFGIHNTGALFLSKAGADNLASAYVFNDAFLHHVAVTKSGTTVVFYVDGVVYPAPVYSSTFTFGTGVAIGARGDDLSGNFAGEIDELSFYNRALAASEVQAIYNAGDVGKCSLPPVIITQPASRTVIVGGNASFSVTATGSLPLTYQWQFNSNNLSGATTSILNLANVQFNQAGSYDVVVLNPGGPVTSMVATLTVVPPPSLVQAVNVTATSALINVPIDLVAQGTENALGFSVNFDPTLLIFTGASLGSGASGGSMLVNSNQAPAGQLGVAIALASDTTFSAGTNDLVDISFLAVAKTTASTTSIGFGDSPTLRQVSDPDANILPANYITGTVTIPFLGIEGDVTPQPNGDNAVTITDWVQEGRFVAGLDTITNSGEFERADCAPRSTLGDGMLTVADWVQVGRYAAGLDPLTAGGGPTQPSGGDVKEPTGGSGAVPAGGPARAIIMGSTNATPGQTCQISLVMNSQGNENAVGCSINFNPAVLTFVSASLGSGATGSTLNANTKQAASGTMGLALALPIGSSFSAGTQELVRLKFAVASSAANGTALALSSTPVAQSVADADANTLSASYVSGMVTVTSVNGGPTITVSQANGNLVLSWPASATGYNLESSANAISTNWNPIASSPTTNANTINVTVPISSARQFYRLHHP